MMHIDLFGAGLLPAINWLKICICEEQKSNKVKCNEMRSACVFLTLQISELGPGEIKNFSKDQSVASRSV